MTPVFPGIQATDAFVIVPSDTVNIKDDANNTNDFPFVFIHNPTTGGLVKVLPAGQTGTEVPVSVYIPEGGSCPLAVKRVYATSPVPPTGRSYTVN
jgi:hypothetical protein